MQPHWFWRLLFLKPTIRIIEDWEIDFVKSAFVIIGFFGMMASCAG